VTGRPSYDFVLITLFAIAPVILVALLFVAAPYGRHARAGWGPSMSTRAAWLVMESPAVLVFAAFYAIGSHARELVPCVLLGAWSLHYLHRGVIYPLRLRASPERRTPVTVALMAIVFNTANAFVNATWLSEHGHYRPSWLADPRFVLGMLLFVAGYAINRWADAVLLRLRKPGDHGHHIPRGGLYELVSCPNYLGEVLEWIGWAVATWSLAGLAFACFTIANLLPRAVWHHRWYHKQFADYPTKRRALVPFLL
jgi:protein-S-isoprenylcysteine O-methyltransferase Ste14